MNAETHLKLEELERENRRIRRDLILICEEVTIFGGPPTTLRTKVEAILDGEEHATFKRMHAEDKTR